MNSAPTTSVTIERVTDGDTVVLSDGRRVRLIGINTLELNVPYPSDRKWAFSAKTELEKLIQKKNIFFIEGIEEFDRHGRTLGHLILDDGSSVADRLLRKGLGLSIAVGSNNRCADQYELSERLARQEYLGIWRIPGKWLINEQLTGREKGFKLVTSTVINVHSSKGRTALNLNNGLRVNLSKNFSSIKNDLSFLTEQLLGKHIEVRGWISNDSSKPVLTLSHPTNLRVLP